MNDKLITHHVIKYTHAVHIFKYKHLFKRLKLLKSKNNIFGGIIR
jgi:hypothetical protein